MLSYLLDGEELETEGTSHADARIHVGNSIRHEPYLFTLAFTLHKEGMCCQGQYAAAQVPLWWVVRHSLGLQGWEGGDDRPRLMGSPYPSRRGFGRTWKGAGVVVGVSLVDLQKMSGEGRGWHSD